jgi:hypothetical protein
MAAWQLLIAPTDERSSSSRPRLSGCSLDLLLRQLELRGLDIVRLSPAEPDRLSHRGRVDGSELVRLAHPLPQTDALNARSNGGASGGRCLRISDYLPAGVSRCVARPV